MARTKTLRRDPWAGLRRAAAEARGALPLHRVRWDKFQLSDEEVRKLQLKWARRWLPCPCCSSLLVDPLLAGTERRKRGFKFTCRRCGAPVRYIERSELPKPEPERPKWRILETPGLSEERERLAEMLERLEALKR